MEDPNNPKIDSKPDSKIEPKSKSIKTYASDMASTIEDEGGVLLKNLIHEQEKAEAEKKKYSPQSSRNRAFTFAGFALLGMGAIAIMFITVFQREVERVEVPGHFVPLIFTNKTEFVDITDLNKDNIANAVRSKTITLGMPPGEVAGIYLASGQDILPFREFLRAIQSSFPNEGFDFVAENFFTGIRGQDAGPGEVVPGELFFVIKTSSFIDIFPVMQQWENKMFHDLGLFFQDGTNPLYASALSSSFQDGWVLNKNARLLTDAAGGLALMYIFVDDRTVVVTASYDAAEEAILRLSEGEVRK